MSSQSRPVGKTPPKINELPVKNINLFVKGHGARPIAIFGALLAGWLQGSVK
jgi:hypothetical protein